MSLGLTSEGETCPNSSVVRYFCSTECYREDQYPTKISNKHAPAYCGEVPPLKLLGFPLGFFAKKNELAHVLKKVWYQVQGK